MSESDEGPPTRDELETLEEIMVEIGETEERIERVLNAAKVDREFYEDLIEMYTPVRPALADDTADFRRLPVYDGEFIIGENPDGHPVGLTHRQVNEHMMIAGRTGAGKTTFFRHLIDTFNDWHLPVLVFDFKNDYRHVADDLDLTVINWQDFKFNPLEPPPGVRTGKWAEELADAWTHSVELLGASRNHLLPKLNQLYNLYEGEIDRGRYPSLFELRELVDDEDIPYASPRFRYQERIVSRLDGMLAFSGNIFDCASGFPIEALLDQNVVIELQEPNRYVQTFVVEALLTWLFLYRDAQDQRQGLRHVVMFDEAKQVFDRQREENPDSPNPPITRLMGQVREFGEALIVADHEPSKLSDSLKANTYAKLWLSLGSGKDTEEMAETFRLDDDQTDYTASLERGEAVLWTADGKPTPVELPAYHVHGVTSETEVRERMDAVLSRLGWEERVRPRYFLEAIGEWSEEDAAELGDIAKDLLINVAEEPLLSVTERYDVIDVGSQTGTDAKEKLCTVGYLDEVPVRNGRPGRNPKLLELTADGRRAVEEWGYEVQWSSAGVEHRWWQQRIKEYYEEQGYAAEIEYAVGQDRIDVYAEGEDAAIAVEVARGPRHELQNIMKCLEFEVDRVQVAYLDDSVKDQVEAQVLDEFGRIPERVVFVPCSEFS